MAENEEKKNEVVAEDENENKVPARQDYPRHSRYLDIFSPFFGDDLVDALRSFELPRFESVNRSSLTLRSDIRDLGNSYEMEIEIPGVDKKDVSIKLKDGYLTVRASLSQSTDDEKKNYVLKERFSGSASRSWYVGENITKDDIHAKVDNGILTITFPKNQVKAEKNEEITID